MGLHLKGTSGLGALALHCSAASRLSFNREILSGYGSPKDLSLESLTIYSFNQQTFNEFLPCVSTGETAMEKKNKKRCNLKTHGAEGLMGDTDKEMSNYNA